MTDHTATDAPPAVPAVGAQLEPGVGRLVPERDGGDGELLWKAAIAAGYEPRFYVVGNGWYLAPLAEYWNPLDDDSAAFRLALLLRISVWRDDDLMRVGTLWEAFAPGANVAAIARRLIVRAAAMCGKPPNGLLNGGR